MTVHNIYFSPARSTRRIARAIAGGVRQDAVVEYDITMGVKETVKFAGDDFVVISVPVYAGRVPALAAGDLEKFSADGTPVAISCVYGNRDYDDALLELSDICRKQGFKVVGAGAFIARHSIFPKLASDRPNENDIAALREFGRRCAEDYAGIENPVLEIKGNRPYKEAKRIPLAPAANRRCEDCGVCAAQCPVGAINPEKPKATDKDKCIGCTRCIVLCPHNARSFRGVMYKIASKKFLKTYSAAKENEFIYPHNA